jgi:hypothetical protein
MSADEHRHTLPDGRELRATYEGEPAGWVVHVAGAKDRPVAAREIHDALVDLLDPGPGLWPEWFKEAARVLSGFETPLGRRYICPCCGHLTLTEPPAGTFAICKVCFWEDDDVQFRNPDSPGGANRVSLNEARANFARDGVSEPRFAHHVRPPLPEERRGAT